MLSYNPMLERVSGASSSALQLFQRISFNLGANRSVSDGSVEQPALLTPSVNQPDSKTSGVTDQCPDRMDSKI